MRKNSTDRRWMMSFLTKNTAPVKMKRYRWARPDQGTVRGVVELSTGDWEAKGSRKPIVKHIESHLKLG